MAEESQFVDYYSVLQVEPGCDAKTLESAYRFFAKMYHPDHAEFADVGRFSEVTQAYKMLRNPQSRAEYDRTHFPDRPAERGAFAIAPELDIDPDVAVSDAEIHEKILLHLYKRRREHAYDPGVIGWLLQEALECSDDSFEFHVWYLRSKGFLEITEQGGLAITIQGVDHVISTSRASASVKLLIAQSAQGGEQDAEAATAPDAAPDSASGAGSEPV